MNQKHTITVPEYGIIFSTGSIGKFAHGACVRGVAEPDGDKVFRTYVGGYHKLHAEPEGMGEQFARDVGEWIVLKSSVNRVFRTSMEVGVKVFAENVFTGEQKHTSSAYLTFVAIDHNRQPKPVPPLILETVGDQRRYDEAGERRRMRLALRNKERSKS